MWPEHKPNFDQSWINDVHVKYAAQLFLRKPYEVTPKMRQEGIEYSKQLNFNDELLPSKRIVINIVFWIFVTLAVGFIAAIARL